jgi:hypothetical protein
MVLACGLLAGQQSTVAGPVAGFVFDGSARVLRPIQGVPGASLLGDAVNFGFALAAVYVSPRQDSAFVVGADNSLHLFRLNSGAVAEVGLGNLAGVPQTVVFSPSGTAAALFAMGKARVLTGLPNAPALAGTVAVPDSGQVTARPGRTSPGRTPIGPLALSDDGAYLLTVAQGSVRLLNSQGENRSLVLAGPDAFVAFGPGGHDAAVMDPVAGLTLLRDAAGAASPQVLATPGGGLIDPVGLAFSQDAATLYVASGTAQSVTAFNLAAGGSRSAIGCACTPSILVPMGKLFRLNDLGRGPLWLLDTGGGNPRMVFVPASGH